MLIEAIRRTPTIPSSWASPKLYFVQTDSTASREIYRSEYHVKATECCVLYNWGLPCMNELHGRCNLWHVCYHEHCRTIFNDDHRLIQHAPTSICRGHSRRLQGMNILHPKPLSFPEQSSEQDTQEACQTYNVKPPSLNADLFEELLRKTSVPAVLTASLVRAWREGF